MRFHGLNLNLIASLQVLLEECSVSVAARKMHLSQSSMSGILARLREHYGDPILEISGRKMIRTPFAESLVLPVKEAMEHMERLASASASFVPASSSRRFSVVTSDYMMQILLPHVMTSVAQSAPNVSIQFSLPSGRPGETLNKGNIDIMICPDGYAGAPFVSEPFCEEDFVVVGWKDNKEIAAVLDMTQFRSLKHVGVHFPIAADVFVEGSSPSFGQVSLRNAGCEIDVAVAVPTFSTAFAAVIGTTFITVAHRRLAMALADPRYHVVRELPLAIEPLRESLVYHPLRNQDAGLVWLKDILRNALKSAATNSTLRAN